jgi:membrane associated rhomboid family serine protease
MAILPLLCLQLWATYHASKAARQQETHMFDPNANESPINPIPTVILILAMAIGGIEIMLQLGEHGFIGGREAIGWRVGLIESYGLSGRLMEFVMQTRNTELQYIGRYLTYPFLHLSLPHAAFATIMILALGKAVAEVFHTISVLIIFFASTILGAIAYGLICNTQTPFIGAFPAVYAFLGTYTWMLWLNAGATGQNRLSAFRLVGFLVMLQLTFRFVVPLFSKADIPTRSDWIADLTGFIVGFLLSFILAPDGRTRIKGWIHRIRQR